MKKISKAILGSALAIAASGIASAQAVGIHGYMDYTNFAAAQEFKQASSSDWTASDCCAEFGSFYYGRTEINANVTAANFVFNLGMRMNASLGSWYDSYYVTKYATTGTDYTYFHQGNMRVGFFNDQLFVHTGKFEEWNDGYVFNGYQMGGQYVQELASRDAGQHITALEFIPRDITGLKLFAGIPVIPIYGNSVQVETSYNSWKNLYKTAKFAASYKVLPINTTFNVMFRPGTYYASKAYVTTSYFGEGMFQADMPTLIPYTKLNATYTIRYRENSDVNKYVTAHTFGASAQIKPVQNLTINVEDRFAYAADHYVATNDSLIYDALAIGAIYDIPQNGIAFGINTFFTYAQDTLGTWGTASGNNSNTWTPDFAITSDWMTACAAVTSGTTGRYIGAYGYPYFQKNFGNGYFRAGVEVQYTHYQTSDASQAVTYRVPLNFCFWY